MPRMWPSVLLVLLGLQVHGATDSFSVIVSPTPVSARLGDSATLPCWLSPAISAEAMEIRWYRPEKFTSPVLYYRERKIQQSPQDPQYEDRVSLSSRSPTTGGLKEGDVSLLLENVTLSDNGKYECYVSSDKMYNIGVVDLQVNVLGTPLVMSSVLNSDGILNVSCVSSGWHPRPALSWADGEEHAVPPGAVQISQAAGGLLLVRSWILAPPSRPDLLSCTISIPDGAKREGRLSVKDTSCSCPDHPLPWQAAFICTLLLAIAGALLFWNKDTLCRKLSGSKPSSAQPEEETLLSEWENYKNAQVDITLDNSTRHPSLKLSDDKKTVRDAKENGSSQSSCNYCSEMYVLGEQTFSSGSAYWEVVLKLPKTEAKKVWGVGVATVVAKNNPRKAICSSKGFWVLSLHNGKLHTNTDPPVVFQLEEELHTLGVFLNYDKGYLCFINPEKNKFLLTFFAKFTEKVYPLFNPGIGDAAPLKLSAVVDGVEAYEGTALLVSPTV